jgi:peptidoglycan/LPS O-acetylase OafA/YrhL
LPGEFRLGNRPPLTGIRALALVPVVVYHSNYDWMPGSQVVSLQIFFVLSGFLITSMLASEARRNGRISLKRFYARRIVRLYPPIVLTVALIGIYSYFVYVAAAASRVWSDALAALFYYYDYRVAFGHGALYGFFGPCWSLSIEEQFYVLWAILMTVAVATHRRRLAYGFAIGGTLLSLADTAYLTLRVSHVGFAEYARIYYAFDTRAYALFLGCLLGLLASDGWYQNWSRSAQRMLAAAAALSAAFLVWLLFAQFGANWIVRIILLLFPLSTLAAAIIVTYFVICPNGWGSRFTGLRPLVYVGQISYTIYLIHVPVYLALVPYTNRTTFSVHWFAHWLLALAVIAVIASASWHFMEKPLQAWRDRSAAK